MALSTSQHDFILKLLTERDLTDTPYQDPMFRFDGLSSKEASTLIDRLLKLPMKTKPITASGGVSGYYRFDYYIGI